MNMYIASRLFFKGFNIFKTLNIKDNCHSRVDDVLRVYHILPTAKDTTSQNVCPVAAGVNDFSGLESAIIFSRKETIGATELKCLCTDDTYYKVMRYEACEKSELTFCFQLFISYSCFQFYYCSF